MSRTLVGLPPVSEPPADVDYTGLLRRADRPAAVPAIALVLGLSAAVLVPTLISALVYGLGWLMRGRREPFDAYLAQASAFQLPEGMLGAHLGLASLIVVTLAILHRVGGLPTRWVHSVQPGLRWRYLLACLLASLAILGGSLWIRQLAHAGAPHPQEGFWWFLAIIVLTTPLQAAGEEYFFRGFGMITLGGLIGSTVLTVLVTSGLFALMHGVQNPAMFATRFAFGLIACLLVALTGGLEAAIAAHVANNLLAFTAAGLWGTIADARKATEITWAQTGAEVGTYALVAVACWAIGKALNVATRTPAQPSAS